MLCPAVVSGPCFIPDLFFFLLLTLFWGLSTLQSLQRFSVWLCWSFLLYFIFYSLFSAVSSVISFPLVSPFRCIWLHFITLEMKSSMFWLLPFLLPNMGVGLSLSELLWWSHRLLSLKFVLSPCQTQFDLWGAPVWPGALPSVAYGSGLISVVIFSLTHG